MQYEISRPHSKFQLIDENELQKVIDKVRRHRMKCKEKEIWSEFCCKELKKLTLQNADEISLNEIKNDLPYEKSNIQNEFQYMFHSYPHQNTVKLSRQKTNSNDESLMSETETRSGKHRSIDKSKNLSYSCVTAISVPCTNSSGNSFEKNFMEKFDFTCSKILNILDVIELSLNDIHVPETPKEILQYQKKALEFCVRFSRNHFYQIETQFKQFMSITTGIERMQVEKNEFCYQITLKLSQTLLTGFYTFYRHMHVVWGYKSVAEKLNEVLEITQTFFNMSRKFFQLKNVICLNKTESVVNRIINFLKNFMENKYLEFSESHKKKKSLTERSAAPSKKNDKRRIKSANSADPYYMYKSKQMKKNQYNCKICIADEKKTNKPSIDVFKRLTLSKNYSLKQNMHINEKENKLVCKKLTERIQTGKNPDNVTNVSNLPDKCVDRLTPFIADHFEEIYNVTHKKSNKIPKRNEISNRNDGNDTKRKTCNSRNVKSISMTHKCNDDSEMEPPLKNINNEELLKNYHDHSEIRACLHDFSKRRSHSDSDLLALLKSKEPLNKMEQEQNNINEISNDLIKNELSSITTEIDTPLKNFIKKEVVDFSNFLYKTCSINRQNFL